MIYIGTQAGSAIVVQVLIGPQESDFVTGLNYTRLDRPPRELPRPGWIFDLEKQTAHPPERESPPSDKESPPSDKGVETPGKNPVEAPPQPVVKLPPEETAEILESPARGARSWLGLTR